MSSQLPQLKKIIMEKYIYSVVGLEASNFVPEVSLDGSKNNFSCFFLFFVLPSPTPTCKFSLLERKSLSC